MKFGIYPGCSLTGSARDYNESVFALAEAFGLEFVQVPDWNCCGATAAHNLNKELSLALPARILALAEKNELAEIVVPCAACYSRLVVTRHELRKNPELKNRISEVIEMDYRGTSEILNVIEWIDKYIIPKLDEKIVKPFNHKVACYYGCLLVRPDKVLCYDRAEDPQTMDVVMRKIGSETVDYPYKTECCGAGLSVSRTDIVSKLSGKIIEDAEHRGADAIIVACPMCHSNLDMRRPDINKYWDTEYKIPVIFVTQAIGLAIGLQPKQVGLKRHFVEVKIS
ncbi:MAG: heterodisulfide reductase subunit B [Bacteroidetes bacterium]|nr:MAG: heterodisulfide reductase subunit B [Bacteroidota bacterium]